MGTDTKWLEGPAAGRGRCRPWLITAKAGLGSHVMMLLPSPPPGLMGRAIPPERHSPHHLKEQHHIRGSITQGTLPSAPQAPPHAWPPRPRGSYNKPSGLQSAWVGEGRHTRVPWVPRCVERHVTHVYMTGMCAG